MIFLLGTLHAQEKSKDITIKAQDIYQAVSDGDLDSVKKIVEAYPEAVNSSDDKGNTPLHIAVLEAKVDILQYLITNGADINAKNRQSMSPLYYACLEKKTDVVQMLVQHGADVNTQPSALLRIAMNGDRDLVQILLTAGADVDVLESGGTPLQQACYNGHVDVAEILIQHGADPNKPGWRGQTPLMMATLNGKPEAVRLLLEQGADPDLKDSQYGWTALYAAIFTSQEGGTEAAKLLIQHGADIYIRVKDGDTPILNASRKGLTEVVDLLIKKGVDASSMDEIHRRTLLHLAAINGYKDLAELLISKDVDVQAKDIYNKTPLNYAVMHGNQLIADLLVLKGADPKEVKKAEAFSHRLTSRLKENEATIWYLKTRGWAVKTTNHLFVFDNEETGRPPDSPALANGYITCPEIKDFSTYAIYSCYHAEPNTLEFIHGFEDEMKDITYIHFEGDKWRGNKNTVYIDGQQTKKFDDVEIVSSRMDEDAWTLQYLIKDESVTFFYPGFLHRKLEFFKKEIDYLAEHCEGVDFAFLYIPDDDPMAESQYINYLIEKLNPKAIFPMVPDIMESTHLETVKVLQRQYPKLKAGLAVNPGDYFYYSNGRLK